MTMLSIYNTVIHFLYLVFTDISSAPDSDNVFYSKKQDKEKFLEKIILVEYADGLIKSPSSKVQYETSLSNL